MSQFEHRNEGYRLLAGNGLEIGAFHQPARVPEGCGVTYCDAHSREESGKLFPEMNIDDLVVVDRICDLDTEGLSPFADETFDFVILNHVIEHVANPIRVIEELFRVTRSGGRVVLSAPDKAYTFDKERDLTPFDHLLADYRDNVVEVSDAHYVDFLKGVYPGIEKVDEKDMAVHVAGVKARREHAHVWDSDSFREFLMSSFGHLGISPSCLFESGGQANGHEHFSVWRKEGPEHPAETRTSRQSFVRSAFSRLAGFFGMG